jgi:hypothetical protein
MTLIATAVGLLSQVNIKGRWNKAVLRPVGPAWIPPVPSWNGDASDLGGAILFRKARRFDRNE